MSEWLPHQLERRPWLAFVLAIAIMGGLAAYDVVRLGRARQEMPGTTWLAAVLLGVALVPLVLVLVVWVARHHLSCVTLAALVLPWAAVFGVTHPRHSGSLGDSLGQAWLVTAVVVADLPVLVGIGVGLWKAWSRGGLWHPAPPGTAPEGELSPEELQELRELAADAEKEPSKPRWSDRIDAVRSSIARNLPLLFFLILGSTLVVGLPVGLFSDQGFGNGLVVGALLGLAVWGLVIIALTFAALAVMLVELLVWIGRRVGRVLLGSAPEQR